MQVDPQGPLSAAGETPHVWLPDGISPVLMQSFLRVVGIALDIVFGSPKFCEESAIALKLSRSREHKR